MSEIITKEQAERNVLAALNDKKVQAQLGAALPGVGIKPETFVRWCVTALRKQPALLKTNRNSLLGAMVQAAQLGLDPSGATGQAYLVPFGAECTFIVGYRGYINLAYRSGQIASIDAKVVYANDAFSYAYGLHPKLEHVPCDGDRGDLRAAYAVARIKGGETVFVVLTAGDIERIKASSASARSKSSPWASHPASMWQKSAIRQLSKLLPLSTEAMAALGRDEDDDERGIPPIISIDDFTITDAEPVPAAAPSVSSIEQDRKDNA